MDWIIRAKFILLCIAFSLTSIHNVFAEQRVVCYYTNWSVYRPGTAKFSPQNINPYLCTHLIYAFGGFTKDNTLKPFDKYQDIEKGGYAKFNGLKTYNKKLKTMLAIGGWNEGSSRFSALVADAERREELVKNSVKFLRQNHFDGLDLDWEYPAFRDGGKPRDKNNYADFVQELREEFERESSKTGRPRLLLSMAIPAGIEYLEKGYDLPRLNEYLDFFNLLSYDYHSAFEPAVNHHSPLYGLQEDNEYNYDNELTIDYTISYLLRHEVTPNKLILGIPTYGRSYTLFNEEATEIGAPADGPGEEGDATREKGYLAYYEICENIGKSDEWEVVQPNPKAMGPYAVRGNQWVGYDDEDIVRLKAQYVTEKELGGIMFWSIDNDDFRGKCHDRPYPLIEAAKEAMLTGNNRKNRPNSKTKSSSDRKKTRHQSSNQRSEGESTRHRGKSGTHRQRISSTSPSTRKRIYSNARSSGKNRVNIEENDEDQLEDIEPSGNSVRESSNRDHNKLKPRTRANRIAPKKRAQPRRSGEQMEDEFEEDEEPSSNKLTTPEPPTTPDPGSDFKCQDEGFFPHPRDCKKYFWCLDSGPSGLGIVANQFTCPSGLVFNKIADSCDYPRNVVCPKTKSPATVSTTKAPKTTSRTTFQERTTRRTTTTEVPNSAEEYEYDDEDLNDAEIDDDEEEVMLDRKTVQTTTVRTLVYKTLTRNKPPTTTTEVPTTVSRTFKQTTHSVLDLKDEEDPKVLKELIDLIKKAGGLEQLEKQLNLHENHSPNKEDNKHITPATISRSLYERVLNRQAPRITGLFSESTTRTVVPKNDFTAKIASNSRASFQNGPGGAQFEGLDDVPEVKSLRRTFRPQYVTIERPKLSSTQIAYSDENTDDFIPQQDEVQDDNTDVASSEEHTINNPPDEDVDEDTLTKKAAPSYVNIRRTRPTTHIENDDSDEPLRTKSTATESNEQQHNFRVNETQPATPKSRYTNVQRFRSTTAQSIEPMTSMGKSSDLNEHTTIFSIDPTTNGDFQEAAESSDSPHVSPQTTPAFNPTLRETTVSANDSVILTGFTTTSRSILTTVQEPNMIDPVVALIENSVPEIGQTSSITTTPNTPSTKAIITIAQPRPFGFPRRGRPTTTSIPTTTSSATTTDQSGPKVSNIPTRNFVRVRTRAKTTTESTLRARQRPENDESAVDENNREKAMNRASVNSRRRGSSKFTTAAVNTSIDEAASHSIPPQSTKTAAATTDNRQPSSKRRRERLTTTSIKDTTTETSNRRRRPILRSSDEPLVDSPIIRITPGYSDEKQIHKPRRGGFRNNSIDDQEEITNIQILKISDQIDTNIDSLNSIEATTSANEITTDLTPLPMTTVPTNDVTSGNEMMTTQNHTHLMFIANSNNSVDTSHEHEHVITEKRPDSSRRKVLLRRRLITPTTHHLSDDQTTFKPNRRRTVVRLLGPVTLAPIDDTSQNPETTTTDLPLPSTILEEIPNITTISMLDTTTVDSSTLAYTTESETMEVTEHYEQSPENAIESTDITTISYSQPSHASGTSVTRNTSSQSTVTRDKPTPRFIRKKFIRKRPIDSTSASTNSTTTRRSGFTRLTSSQLSTLATSNIRRKSLFIRKRPLTYSATTQLDIGGIFDENIDVENKNFTDKTNNSGVESIYIKELPTLKELINNNIETNRNISESAESSTNDYAQNIHMPPKLFGGSESEKIVHDQIHSRHVPKNTLNSSIWHNFFEKQFANDLNYNQVTKQSTDSAIGVTEERMADTTETFTEIEDTSVIIPSTTSVIRGFYVTKSLVASENPKSTHVGDIPTDILDHVSENSQATEINPVPLSYMSELSSNSNFTQEQTTNKYLGNTSMFPSITITNILKNNLEFKDGKDYHREVLTESPVTDTTTSEVITKFTTAIMQSRTDSASERPVKQIVIRRRPTLRSKPRSNRQHVASSDDENIIRNVQMPRPGDWTRRIIKKRPITHSTSDQTIAESQPHELVALQISPTMLFDVPYEMRSGDMNASVEVNLFRGPSTLARKPGEIAHPDSHNRARTSPKRPLGNNKSLDIQHSTRVSDVYDQSGRAQELLAASIADPPTATPIIDIGNESALQIRGIHYHKIGTRHDVHTELPTNIKTSVTPVRRRQGPKREQKMNFDARVSTSRRPAIVDYDYYVDEEVRLSIKPELKNKIYITKTGGIRCLDQGNFAHPTSCKKFITCAPMVGGRVIATEYTCPAKLSFDPVGGICNWSAGLGCKP